MAKSNAVIKEILRQGRGRNKRHVKAALETGRIESNFTNPSGGDRDSAGWRQERRSLYPNPTNIRQSVARFYREAEKLDRGQPSWELAADVQRPAAQYRGRYKNASGEANSLLRGKNFNVSSRSSKVSSGVQINKSSRSRSTFDRAGYERAQRGQTLARLFADNEGGSVLTRTGLLSQAPVDKADFRRSQTTESRRVGLTPGGASEGGREAGRRPTGELKELIWRGQGAQTVKDGKRVPTDFYTAHKDHVHVAAGVGSLRQLEHLAHRMGGRLSTPIEAGGAGHVKGSYHGGKRGKGGTRLDAIDVVFDNPDQMARFARRVAKQYGL